jgi:hypothetical protein
LRRREKNSSVCCETSRNRCATTLSEDKRLKNKEISGEDARLPRGTFVEKQVKSK